MAKGLVGAVADPISGALDAMSATAQGMDAFMSKSKAELLVGGCVVVLSEWIYEGGGVQAVL